MQQYYSIRQNEQLSRGSTVNAEEPLSTVWQCFLIISYAFYVPVEVDLDGSCSSFWGQGYSCSSTLICNVHINIAKTS